MLTTPLLAAELAPSEGFRGKAYDDKQPWLDLNPGDEHLVKGKVTYGHGLTKRDDGTPVQLGDTITESKSWDRMVRHIREEIDPILDNIIHVPLAGVQYNALGHAMYQYGGSEMSGWNLIRLINNPNTPWQDIVEEWINGTVMFMGEPDFWGRRVKEVLMFLGLDHRAARNIPYGTDLVEAIEKLGFDGNLPKPDPIVDEDLFKELEIPKRGAAMEDPTPSTPLTPDDKTYQGYVAAVGGDENAIPYADFMAHRKVVTERNAIKAPNVDVKSEPKAVEDSKTGRGFAKETSGRDDAWIGGVIAGASTMAGTASGISKDVSTITKNTETVIGGATLHQLIIFGLIIGGFLLAYGAWKMYRGEQIKKEGRAEATQLKV